MTSSMNTKTTQTGWIKWMDEHSTSNTYNEHPDKVAKICSSSSALGNFESLCKCKNLVLLTRAPIGKKVQATFLHSTIGLSILPDDLQYVARIGTKVGTGVEVDPESIFKWTTAGHVPDIVDLMKADTQEKFEAVSTNKNKLKKKVQSFALLTPAIAQAVHHSGMSPAAVFLTILDCIRICAKVSRFYGYHSRIRAICYKSSY